MHLLRMFVGEIDFRGQFLFRLGSHFVLALLPMAHLGIAVLVEGKAFLFYQVFADFAELSCWVLSMTIVLLEYKRLMKNNWMIKVFWISAFLLESLRLQVLINMKSTSGSEFIISIASITLSCLLCFQTMMCKIIPESTYTKIEIEEDESEIDLDADYDFGESPEEKANIFSRATFHWLTPLLSRGYKKIITERDLCKLSKRDESELQADKWSANWEAQAQHGTPSVLKNVLKIYLAPFAFGGLFKLVQDIMLFVNPYVLQLIIRYMSDPDAELSQGIFYAFILLVAAVVQSFALHNYFIRVYRIRAALIDAIYRKSFKLSFSARQKYTVGEILQHQSLDAQRLQNVTPYFHMVWSAPFQIIVSIIMLWQVVGPSILGGLLFLFLIVPMNVKIGRILTKYQKDMMNFKDERTKSLNEVFQGIRVIKFFAWENSFIDQVSDIRDAEMGQIKKSAYLRAFITFFWGATPVIMSVITFFTYIALGNNLTAEVVFTTISLFNILRFPVNMVPMLFSNVVDTKVSLDRLQEFLSSEELDEDAVEHVHDDIDETALKITDGSFTWSDTNTTLSDINIDIPKGQLVAVVGSVGSGKSSLLSSMLGEIPKVSGHVKMNGTVSYVPQQAWLQNATLRDNITFGTMYQDHAYNTTIDVCELETDIDMLPGGDLTEIGENGINLSGGQKQRVNLARAVYQDTDIYLFDDPLSAVDAHVGKSIFYKCIKDHLSKKTRILVTHQLQFVSNCDYIIVLTDGKISECGTYSELMDHNGPFSTLMNTHVGEKEEGNEEEEEEKEEQDAKVSKGSKLIKEETSDKGEVKSKVYIDYIKAIGGVFVALGVVAMFGLDVASRVGTNYFLAIWSEASESAIEAGSPLTSGDQVIYLVVYAVITAVMAFFAYSKTIAIALAGLKASKNTHHDMLESVMHSPTSFFDTTPTGRILNRFTKDIYTIDQTLPNTLGSAVRTTFNTLSVLVVIASVTPFFLVILVPLMFIYRYVQQYYLRSSREVKRLESVSKSPIFALFSETITGISTIRSYKREDKFIALSGAKVDANQKAYYLSIVANRWLGLRLEIVGTLVVFGAAFFAVIEKGTLDASLVGLSITYALQLTGSLNWLVRMSTDVETNLVSVERVSQYSSLTQEAPSIIRPRPREDWPAQGNISFEDYSLRYREKLPLVLKNIDLTIKSKEKVGIVGRTGAGKSSLMSALFRICEAAEGTITIDGVNISEVGLYDLRSRLAIIPQDPTLFKGTVRSNLDPFDNFTDDQVWESINAVGIRSQIDAMSDGLQSEIHEFGSNLSAGTKQLMCMARALLRQPRILILDEATASVDFESDALIQQTIREKFADCTMLTIAHRINTIMDSDKVLVLDQGEVAEFDTPEALLSDPTTLFSGLVQEFNSGRNQNL